MRPIDDLPQWESRFVEFLTAELDEADAAHDLAHIERVVANAERLMTAEQAEPAVVIPAAYLHDCVVVAKDSPLRSQASRMAADRATTFLRQAGYPEAYLDGIAHAIAAHSYSAQIPAETIEAQVVQDADRLDSLGAIGIARCILTGQAMGNRPLYNPTDPFAESRPLDEKAFTIDHFFTKLFNLAEQMNTAAGRREAEARTRFMHQYLRQLGHEAGRPYRAEAD